MYCLKNVYGSGSLCPRHDPKHKKQEHRRPSFVQSSDGSSRSSPPTYLSRRSRVFGRGTRDYAARTKRSTLAAPLRIFVAIMILEIPLMSTETPTSVPIAQRELEGHFARISMPSSRLVAASKRNHLQHPRALVGTLSP